MERAEVIDTVQAVVEDILGETPNSPTPPPPPGASAGNAPPQQYNNVQVVGLPQDTEENLVPVGTVNGEVVYGTAAERFALCVSAASPLNSLVSQKRKRERQQNEARPYVTKPPNAFMMFRKEQRPKVVAKLNVGDSAMWKLLSKEEQASYYEEAEKERRLHAQRFPVWSPVDNYGKKRKRIAPNRAEVSVSKPEEVTQRAKKPCVTPVQTAVTEPPTSQTSAMGAPHAQPPDSPGDGGSSKKDSWETLFFLTDSLGEAA